MGGGRAAAARSGNPLPRTFRELLRCFRNPSGESAMQDHVYKVIEIVGSSEKSIEDAIQKAVARAGKTLRHLRWFEVVRTSGHLEDGRIHHYQVTLKIGFTMDDE